MTSNGVKRGWLKAIEFDVANIAVMSLPVPVRDITSK